MLLLLRSTRKKLAGRFRSLMAVIWLKAIDNDLTFGYSFSALAGTWVNLFAFRLMVSTSNWVVFWTLVSTLVNVEPSIPWLAHEIVNVVVLPLVAPQMQGAMSAAYVGHSQMSGDKTLIGARSVQKGSSARLVPWFRKEAVEPFSCLNAHFKLPQLIAVQSIGPKKVARDCELFCCTHI